LLEKLTVSKKSNNEYILDPNLCRGTWPIDKTYNLIYRSDNFIKRFNAVNAVKPEKFLF
jgi:hypothetical protein